MLKTSRLLNHASVIQTWLKKWYASQLLTYFLRLVQLCWLRLISLARTFSACSARAKGWLSLSKPPYRQKKPMHICCIGFFVLKQVYMVKKKLPDQVGQFLMIINQNLAESDSSSLADCNNCFTVCTAEAACMCSLNILSARRANKHLREYWTRC